MPCTLGARGACRRNSLPPPRPDSDVGLLEARVAPLAPLRAPFTPAVFSPAPRAARRAPRFSAVALLALGLCALARVRVARV